MSMTEAEKDIQKDFKTAVDIQQTLNNMNAFDAAPAWIEVMNTLKRRRRKTMFITYFQRAAVILFLPLLGVAIFLGLLNVKNNQKRSVLSIVETYVPVGSRSEIVLPDSSIVWLNSGSRLRYPSQFNAVTREVMLEGEGYFQVHSNKKHPFIVNLSNKIQVKAYGTKFNISSYKDDPSIITTLISGSVGIFLDTKCMSVLKPHEQCQYDKTAQSFTHQAVVSSDEHTWTQNRLSFRDTPLDAVLLSLSHRFGVRFKVSYRRKTAYRVRATFGDESLNEILNSLKMVVPITWRVCDDNIKESKKNIEVFVN